MAKVIKLKLSDIEKIVKKTINEAEFDDFDTKIQPEELPGYEDYEAERELEKDEMNVPAGQEIILAKDKQGNVVVANVNTGEILGSKPMN
jgi:hypothetical protein